MRNPLVSALITGVLLSALGLPAPANADQIVITGGTIGEASPNSGIDWTGFILTSSDSSFSGVTADSNVPTPPAAGGTANLSNRANLVSTIPFPLATQQVVHGTTYMAFVNGSLTFTSTPFVVPPATGAGTSFAFSSPFTATGHISGRATNDPNAPVLFSVDLSGSGTATVRGVVSDPAHPFYNAMIANYEFTSAASPASTPEPRSVVLLLVTGLPALVAFRQKDAMRRLKRQLLG